MTLRAEIELRVAKGIRFTPRRLGRTLLVLAMTSSSLVASSVGEAMVLHQHGGRWVHLHTLGTGELRSDAAWSARFGHPSRAAESLQSGTYAVRILAIIATGSIFIASSSNAGDDTDGPDAPHHAPASLDTEPQTQTGVGFASSGSAAWLERSTSSDILRRHHSFLI